MQKSFELPFRDDRYTVAPSKIVALGLNYRAHIEESLSVKVRGFTPEVPEEPVLFPKLPSSIIGPGETIVLPEILTQYQWDDERTDYEGELAIIIGRDGKHIAAADAIDYILGFTCANDVSQRNIQNGDRSGWFRGKSFDTFLPLGPRIVPASEIGDVGHLAISTRRNGETVQSGNTAQMIVKIPEIIAFVSRNFTLRTGDIILTGTPSGIGPIEAGDTIDVEIEGIGTLSNPVAREG